VGNSQVLVPSVSSVTSWTDSWIKKRSLAGGNKDGARTKEWRTSHSQHPTPRHSNKRKREVIDLRDGSSDEVAHEHQVMCSDIDATPSYSSTENSTTRTV